MRSPKTLAHWCACRRLAPHGPAPSAAGPALAVDHGKRRIGLALSDAARILASPLATLSVKSLREALDGITAAAATHGATVIVVGLPLRLDGSTGPAAAQVRKFARALRDATTVPVVLLDERLTTALAHRELIAAGVSPSRRQTLIDQAAAVAILNSYLANPGMAEPVPDENP